MGRTEKAGLEWGPRPHTLDPMTYAPFSMPEPEKKGHGRIKISIFRDATDKRPNPWETTWEDFVQETLNRGHLTADVAPMDLGYKGKEKPYKQAQPLFSPADFRPGGRQVTADVLHVHLGVIDLDHITKEQLGEFLAHVVTQGYECLIYTGWSHGHTKGATDFGPAENLSMRAIFPLSRPVALYEWAAFWPRLNHLFLGMGDPQCKNPDRGYFVPCCPRARHSDSEVKHWPGKAVDVNALLQGATPMEVIQKAVQAPGGVRVGREELQAFVKKLSAKNPTTTATLKKVLAGEPWAEHGHRDTALFQVCGDLAKAFPKADPSSIAQVFSQSVSHFEPEFTLDMVVAKLTAAQGRSLQEQERKEIAVLDSRKANIRAAFRSQRDWPYSMEECLEDAATLNIKEDEIPFRWIIQHQGAFYFRVGDRYVGPIGLADANKAAHTFLAPATTMGVRLEELTISGEFAQRQATALSMEYGVLATSGVVDLKAQRTHFLAATGTIVEAPCPLRPLEPEWSPEVDQWLRLFAGQSYPHLELWLAYATDLDKPCAALFLEGPPGAGKSLLAKGVSRLWTENQPTTLEQAMGSFNAALVGCPLVFADETMPKDFRGRARTAELRELIQSDSRPLKRKHLPDTTVKGAVRCIIAANNKHVLDGEESLSPWDVAAIVGRIIHIEADPQSQAYLRYLGWAPGQNREDTIAKHVLWLRDNVVRPTSPARFLVESNASSLHRAITTSTTMGSAVTHWLVSFLLDPQRLRGKPSGDSAHLVRVKDGALCVNSRALTDHWDAYRTNVSTDKATAKNVMAGIRGISDTDTEKRIQLSVPGFAIRPKFYVIRTADVCEWAQNQGFSTTEEILTAMHHIDDNRVPEAKPPAPWEVK